MHRGESVDNVLYRRQRKWLPSNGAVFIGFTVNSCEVAHTSKRKQPVSLGSLRKTNMSGKKRMECNAVFMMQLAYEPFIGVWELDPNTLDYEQGRPGRRAIYTIEPAAKGVRFILDADDADGKRMNYTYGGKLDSEETPISNTPLLPVLTMPDEFTVQSILKKADTIIDRWTRRIQPDGQTMVITQHGFQSNGEPFQSQGIYRRLR